jgi:hypothetical protein
MLMPEMLPRIQTASGLETVRHLPLQVLLRDHHLLQHPKIHRHHHLAGAIERQRREDATVGELLRMLLQDYAE